MCKFSIRNVLQQLQKCENEDASISAESTTIRLVYQPHDNNLLMIFVSQIQESNRIFAPITIIIGISVSD